jgi:hypothetical protein
MQEEQRLGGDKIGAVSPLRAAVKQRQEESHQLRKGEKGD